MKHWFVLNTKPGKEELVEKLLSARGIDIFFPKIRMPKSIYLPHTSVIKPLFPGYVFAHIAFDSDEWYMCQWCLGVKRIVTFSEEPCWVPEPVIELIKLRSCKTGAVELSSFKPGQRVRVKSGPLRGIIGIFQQPVSDQGRVRILLDLLRNSTAVELSLSDLEKIG